MSKERYDPYGPRPKAHTRREFLGLPPVVGAGGVFIGGVVVVAAVGYALEHQAKEQAINAKIAEYQQREQPVDALIARFEPGFDRFRVLVYQRMTAINMSEADRKSLSIPFELAEINKSNQTKNLPSIKRKDLQTKRDPDYFRLMLNNPNYFLFDLNDDPTAAASYVPMERAFRLSPDFDANNLLDLLQAYHELVHVGQDSVDRNGGVSAAAYEQFMKRGPTGKNKQVGLYEASAFAEEIFIMNALSFGQLQKEVQAGILDPQKYYQMLNARPEQLSTIEFLLRIAQQVYSGKTTPQGIDSNFLAYIVQLHRSKGIEMYEKAANGFVPSR